MSMQPAPPDLPSTFPTNVDWLMYASMSGSLRPTHTNDVPSHPTARMKHQPSPPALLDGTGLLQMPLQRAESPETKQDNCTNWKHMRTTRSHKRQHEPNETPRHSATHTHLRGSNNTPLVAKPHPLLPTRRAHPFTTAECTYADDFVPWVPKDCAFGTQGLCWVILSEMVRTPCPRCSRASASRPNDERVKSQLDRLVQSEAM